MDKPGHRKFSSRGQLNNQMGVENKPQRCPAYIGDLLEKVKIDARSFTNFS